MGASVREFVEAREREQEEREREILASVDRWGGNVSKAARELEVTVSSLHRMIRESNLAADIDRIREQWARKFRLVDVETAAMNDRDGMARPRHELTVLAEERPKKAVEQILTAMRDAQFEYPHAAASLGVSTRQLRILCKQLEISGKVLDGRVSIGGDRRGRPPTPAPPKKVLQDVFRREGSLTKAARSFGVAAPTVARWARELGVDLP